MKQFNAHGYPTNIVIDKKGRYYTYLIGNSYNMRHHLAESVKMH
jgi:hypothetical protein